MSATATKLTKAAFVQTAKALPVKLGTRDFLAQPKEFSTGSVGFNISEKLEVTLPSGEVVRCQVGLNITVIGSKEWPAQ
jgi:hypothetical protein